MKTIILVLMLAFMASAQLVDARFGHVESTSFTTAVDVGTTGFWYCGYTTAGYVLATDEAAEDFSVEATGYVDRLKLWLLDHDGPITLSDIHVMITEKNDTLPSASDAVIIDDRFTVLSEDSVGLFAGIPIEEAVIDLGDDILLEAGQEYWLHTFPNDPTAYVYLVLSPEDSVHYGQMTCIFYPDRWQTYFDAVGETFESNFILYASSDLVQRTNSPLVRSLEDRNLEVTYAADVSSAIKQVFTSIPRGEPADSSTTRWSVLYSQASIEFSNYLDSAVVAIDSLGNMTSAGDIDTVVIGTDSLRFQGGLYLDKL